MKKGNKSDPCPLCGGERMLATKTSRTVVRARVAVIPAAQETLTHSFDGESSDDQTASDFAAFLLKGRIECK
jgi:hypothetical protein